jgi:hypothetical protein
MRHMIPFPMLSRTRADDQRALTRRHLSPNVSEGKDKVVYHFANINPLHQKGRINVMVLNEFADQKDVDFWL